ncbi:MAG: WhiB family transcriptional regulator [Actinomycetota bacterium]|nr:WhiB family transcriptional regulator [Actinomycetota bacterium]
MRTVLVGQIAMGGSGLERAACSGADVELFFSIEDEDQRQALAYCSRCDVRQQCLEAAIANREIYGIWGGTLESDRRSLIRDIRRRERGKQSHAAA